MITFKKVYISLSRITDLYLNSLLYLINLKNTQIIYMKNYQFQETQFQISDPIESYFECITTCDISDGGFISRCAEILKQNED